MKKRRIAVLTGKRGGYGAMKPLLRAIEADPVLELLLIVTDQHLNPNFGKTISEVEADFTVAAAVDMEQMDDRPCSRVRALGTGLTKMADALTSVKPNILVLYGDRAEVLVTAVAALNLGIPIAHLQGGDISGNIDESMRHAITKLAHLHFSSSAESAERIRRMGEEEWRISVVGDNHVDAIVAKEFSSLKDVSARYEIREDEKPALVLQHPETVRKRDNYKDMRDTLASVLELNRRTIIVYPCSDQGYEGVVRAIEEVRSQPSVTIYKNIPANDFWGLMACAAVLVGNSSAGLIETPYFPISAVDIGERQKGRLRAENVIHVEFGRESVSQALDKALSIDFSEITKNCSRPFGDGQAYRRILSQLKKVDLDEALLAKCMSY